MHGEIKNKFKKNIMQKFWKKNKKGLTLVETILAVAVLSITIMASTAVSSSYLRSRMSIKKYQANNEELSLALNYLAKDIRMSSKMIDSDGKFDSIAIKNNASGTHIVYAFNSAAKTLTRDNIVVANNVTGKFHVKNNSTATSIPIITIKIKKEGTPEMVVQTTVSMRSKYVDEL
jgi:Tfp pilus assembly protein PilV